MPISVQQMKAGITITATLSGSMRGTYQLIAELEALKKRVERLNGKSVFYPHSHWQYFTSYPIYDCVGANGSKGGHACYVFKACCILS